MCAPTCPLNTTYPDTCNAERIEACAYLHETREQRLTDHAAVTLKLGVSRVTRLETGDPTADDALTLF